jgi:hypothetical protein
MKRAILVLPISILMAGCATTPQMSAEERAHKLQPVACKDKAQCDLYWQRSQIWLAKNSRYRIQLANDTLIQTYGPSNSSVDLAYTIVRDNAADGSAQLRMRAGCDNWMGCLVLPADAINAYREYVTSSQSEPRSILP